MNTWTLNIVIQIWRLIFQSQKFSFQFWKLYLNLKFVIAILKHFIWLQKSVFEFEVLNMIS
jgi:hypothetical protein